MTTVGVKNLTMTITNNARRTCTERKNANRRATCCM